MLRTLQAWRSVQQRCSLRYRQSVELRKCRRAEICKIDTPLHKTQRPFWSDSVKIGVNRNLTSGPPQKLSVLRRIFGNNVCMLPYWPFLHPLRLLKNGLHRVLSLLTNSGNWRRYRSRFIQLHWIGPELVDILPGSARFWWSSHWNIWEDACLCSRCSLIMGPCRRRRSQ